MNLAAFEAFVKVMETGSISLAADQLFITQPAVTKRIHSLEEYFGVKLFESAGRGVQATHAAYIKTSYFRYYIYGIFFIGFV